MGSIRNKRHSHLVKLLNRARTSYTARQNDLRSAKESLSGAILHGDNRSAKDFEMEIIDLRLDIKKLSKCIKDLKERIYQAQKFNNERKICLHCKHCDLDLRFGELFYICDVSKFDVDLGETCINGKYESKTSDKDNNETC